MKSNGIFFQGSNTNLFKYSTSQKLLDYYLDTKNFSFFHDTNKKQYLIKNSNRDTVSLDANNSIVSNQFSKWQTVSSDAPALLTVPADCPYLVITVNSDYINTKNLSDSFDNLQCTTQIDQQLVQL